MNRKIYQYGIAASIIFALLFGFSAVIGFNQPNQLLWSSTSAPYFLKLSNGSIIWLPILRSNIQHH